MPTIKHDREQSPMEEDVKRAAENTTESLPTMTPRNAGMVNDEETASASDIDAEAGEEPDLATIDRVYSYVFYPFLKKKSILNGIVTDYAENSTDGSSQPSGSSTFSALRCDPMSVWRRR